MAFTACGGREANSGPAGATSVTSSSTGGGGTRDPQSDASAAGGVASTTTSVVTVGTGATDVATVGTGATSGTGSGGAGGATTGGPGAAGGSPFDCPRPIFAPVLPTSTNISDFDGDGGAVVQAVMGGGMWDIDTDMTGETTMRVEACGTAGKGLHFTGRGHTRWGADVAASMISTVQSLDVSAYRGVSFVVRSALRTPLLLKIMSPYSQPACGRCDDSNVAPDDDCFSGYTKLLETTVDAAPQLVRWSDFAQQSWGYRPLGSATFDTRALTAIAFAFLENVDFDVCIDDVKFER
jgi:hypothetical protein